MRLNTELAAAAAVECVVVFEMLEVAEPAFAVAAEFEMVVAPFVVALVIHLNLIAVAVAVVVIAVVEAVAVTVEVLVVVRSANHYHPLDHWKSTANYD